MIDATLSLAHSLHSSKGVFAVLLGSGISRSAGIPTGWEVTLDLVKRIAVMEGEDASSDPADWYRAKFNKEPEYSSLLDTLAKSPAERRAILHSLFEPTDDEREQGLKLPTKAHRAIAKLVSSGHTRVIVTTNFDHLMELALQDEGVTPTVISTADAVSGAAPLVHQKCVVIKLHGDYLDDRIKNTEEELSSYAPELDGYLDRILDEFGLIICGWSGDWDIALRAAIERCPSRRYTTYWAAKGKRSERAERLITLRGAQVIEIESADAFFEGVADKVASLEELNASPPSSAAVAVASLKRYIADPVHRIRFHDLLINETERVMALNAREPLEGPGTRPEPEAIKQRFLRYDAKSEILRSLLYTAAYWAQPQHFGPIEQSILRLTVTESLGGFTTWLNMRIYPAAAGFYAAGIGAFSSGNWAILQKLVRIQFRQDREIVAALPELVASHVLSKDIAECIEGAGMRYFPLSEHFARHLFSTDQGQSDNQALDRFEVMLALVFIDQRIDEQSDLAYMPRGRFVVHDHGSAYRQLFQEAEAAGESWPPLQAGMFGGRVERFDRVKTVFNAILASSAHRYW